MPMSGRPPDEKQIMSLQERLHAEGKRSVLIVLQGMDTSGIKAAA
jgi:polyphosphate kinase 2 (PPK2 family)